MFQTVNREAEVEVEDEQRFLERQLQILQQQSTSGKDARIPSGGNMSKPGTPDPKRLPSPLPGATPKKVC